VKLLLVFNPHAAVGRAARLLPRVRAALEHFAQVEVIVTAGTGDAVRRVAAANLADVDGVVAAGGDGTLFEVLNGLYRQQPALRLPLGLVPVGTGNAFARDLGLQPGDWEKGVALIGAGRRRRVDVGRVECGLHVPGRTDGGGPDVFHFLNIVGAGLPVDAMRSAERIKFIGNAAYSVAALWRAMVLKTYPLRLELDGQFIEQDALFVEVSNTRYTGTTFLMAPVARLDDGLLDVTVVRRMSRPRLLRLFPTIYQGRHVEFEEVATRQARTVRIHAPHGLALAPDGEIRGFSPATITCLHQDLEIFA